MNETWKEVKDYPFYEVSNLGNVRSLRYGKIKIMKHTKRKDGYKAITLRNKCNVGTFLIHRLVYFTFNETEINGYYHHIDHINNDRSDNRLENLQILSARENSLKINLSNKTSKYKGVCWDSHKKRWKACIRINSKQKTLGVFKTEEEAYDAYLKKRQELLEL